MKHKILEQPKFIGCPNCTSVPQVKLEKDSICAVGFGQVRLIADNITLWHGDDETVTVEMLEHRFASKLQKGECSLIEYDGPLHSETYEFNKCDGEWYLIKQGMGFA